MSRVVIPTASAPLSEVLQFATTTYFAYDRHGSVEGLSRLANSTLDTWRRKGELPAADELVRASLFFEARRWHHFGRRPDDAAEQYIRALIEQLRLLSGGAVKQDRNRLRWRLRRRQAQHP